MKVAFATTDGRRVDEHFGRAGMFRIYEFTKDGYSDLGPRVFSEGRDAVVESTKGQGSLHDQAVEDKVGKLTDCKVVYITAIGGPSAARLTRHGMMPVKVAEGSDIVALAEQLMEAIKSSPPPWLRKLI